MAMARSFFLNMIDDSFRMMFNCERPGRRRNISGLKDNRLIFDVGKQTFEV